MFRVILEKILKNVGNFDINSIKFKNNLRKY